MLHGGGHGHSHGGGEPGHGHSHNGGTKLTKNASSSTSLSDDSDDQHSDKNNTGQNINVRAAFIHVIGDFFQSLGVLIAAYIIYYHVSTCFFLTKLV